MSLSSLRSSQALTNAALAGSLAALIVWFIPPGTDFAAHVFQLHVYLRHGFAFWTNYWYAGRYTFVGYSLLYYPLAALVGIKLLAVMSVAASTAAFSLVIRQQWGEATLWATRFFAVARREPTRVPVPARRARGGGRVADAPGDRDAGGDRGVDLLHRAADLA